MPETQLLLDRLDQIGESISAMESSLALIGLGSVGLDIARLDSFSDLDFFVIVKTGSQSSYLDDLSWLTRIAPVAFYFQNTPDGYKLLFEDGVFCEFAVFDQGTLKKAAFSPGRIIWKAEGVDDDIGMPECQVNHQKRSTEWLVGEALTNLYVGLSREARGEKLSAMRFIQGYAVDRILELTEKAGKVEFVDWDSFDIERRFETRFPDSALLLPALLQGYEKNRESALAVLSFLENQFELNPRMKQEVLKLCHHDPKF
jgi:hypothetical protein